MTTLEPIFNTSSVSAAVLSAMLFSTLAACSPASTQSQTEAPTQAPTQTQSDSAMSVSHDQGAHWINGNTLLLAANTATAKVILTSADSGGVNTSVELRPVAKGDRITSQYPHLSDFSAYHLPRTQLSVKAMLKNELSVLQHDSSGQLLALSGVQTAKVIDELYTKGGNDADEIQDYGATVSDNGVQFKLWAPTATAINVLLFDREKQPLTPATLPMTEDPATGAWSAHSTIPMGSYYQYQISLYHPERQQMEEVIVTDPYSLSLSRNSLYSQVVDLDSPQTQPAHWLNQLRPTVDAPEDNVFYEVHIKDFSASDQAIANLAYRGKYMAFSETQSDGIKHLKALQQAGLNNIHLLPTFDIGTVNEDPQQTLQLNDPLGKLCRIITTHSLCDSQYEHTATLSDILKQMDPDGPHRQAVIESVRQYDDYNWGYDPFHYTVPEGSYALNPDGEQRIIEFRDMIKNIHNLGFRVIMDVVYNHTHEAGLKKRSVLDKIVPGYYHRLDPLTGQINQSTCCDNTATEQVMMAKLMTDSLVVWARDYYIDGFRFDLMGHQPKQAMLYAREAVREVDPDTYFYGEGWNFGEVANNRQFVQATQVEMAGTEIGTYTDRLRDAVRGGASFASGDDYRQAQGIGNGLFTLPNELQPADNIKPQYLLMMDQLRIGLTGNLANFPLENAADQSVTGKDIPYGDQPTGYAMDPADTINYVSKHDNQTLWDNNQYRLPYHMATEDRVRLQLLSLAYPLLSQGIPFVHMGSELLRSKSFLRDSYDYGDWFNRVDFSKRSNNYDVGLPPAVKDQANWALVGTLLEKNQGRDRVTSEQIQWMSDTFMELLQIRSSSSLFRLRTADDIIQRVKFHNTGLSQQSGLIVMSIDDADLSRDLDADHEELLVLFNSSGESREVAYTGAGEFQLHPAQRQGRDLRVKTTRITPDSVTVPALTAAVLIR